MNCQSYILRQGYPAVQPGRPDPQLTRRLFAAYAGQAGEMTAVCQYLYDGLLAALAPEGGLPELFRCLAQTEMRHLELLGQLILAYGGDPGLLSYRGEHKIWWSGDFVHHIKQPARMLTEALEGERAAIRDYRDLLRLMPADGNQAVIERILADEAHHAQLLEQRIGPEKG